MGNISSPTYLSPPPRSAGRAGYATKEVGTGESWSGDGTRSRAAFQLSLQGGGEEGKAQVSSLGQGNEVRASSQRHGNQGPGRLGSETGLETQAVDTLYKLCPPNQGQLIVHGLLSTRKSASPFPLPSLGASLQYKWVGNSWEHFISLPDMYAPPPSSIPDQHPKVQGRGQKDHVG